MTTSTQSTTGMAFPRGLREYGPAGLVFFGGLVLWEVAVIGFGIEEILLPRPSVILTTFFEELSAVLTAARATAFEAVAGFILGGLMGIVVALVVARWAVLREGILPFAIAVNSAPIVALAPISNQWFGITNPVSKIAVVMVMVFFPVMINTVRGLTEIEVRTVELMQSYAATPRDLLKKVRLPNALPYLFSALKVGSTLAVIGAIVAEYFGGPRDTLGVYITQNASLGRIPEAWAAVIIGIIIGVTFYLLVSLAERLLMPWHVSFRSADH